MVGWKDKARIWDPYQVRKDMAKQGRLLVLSASDQIQKNHISHMVTNLLHDYG